MTITPPKLTFSFEFFPPKTEALTHSLWQAVERLKGFDPAFVSVTYGAGGTTRTRTHDIVTALQSQHHLPAAAHLTCVEATKFEIDAIAESYWQAGIRHIVALRGDPAGGVGECYTPHPNGYAFASDLVAGLRAHHPFEISVGAYPEGHPEAVSKKADLEALKRKIDAGAVRAISQFCFDTSAYFQFLEAATRVGITAPIVAGVLPIANWARAQDFAQKCGASLPAAMCTHFDDFDQKSVDDRAKIALDFTIKEVEALYAGGVRHFHFYTLNKADLVAAVCQHLREKSEG